MKESKIGLAADPASAPPQLKKQPPRRILVVDDDVLMRQLNIEILIQHGYEVDSARDGAAGWVALQDKQYDLLITDNTMPNVTGVDLIKMLRRKDAHLPVIMASGTAPIQELKRHPWLDINAILLKPYTVEDLVETVEDVLQGRKEIPGQPWPQSS